MSEEIRDDWADEQLAHLGLAPPKRTHVAPVEEIGHRQGDANISISGDELLAAREYGELFGTHKLTLAEREALAAEDVRLAEEQRRRETLEAESRRRTAQSRHDEYNERHYRAIADGEMEFVRPLAGDGR
jgi:hypothetical protein